MDYETSYRIKMGHRCVALFNVLFFVEQLNELARQR